MKSIVEKLRSIEMTMAAEHGGFSLFVVVLREEAPDRWDVLVAGPWIPAGGGTVVQELATRINKALTTEEVVRLSRIVVIEESNPALAAFNGAISAEHGNAELVNCTLFGLQVKHAFVITSMRREGHGIRPTSASREPVRRKEARAGRNDPCPCGSGKKHKKCCGK